MAFKKKKKRDKKKPESERAFSWYPGHMVKAKRELEQNLKLADAVLMMLDSRAPISTRHPDLEKILLNRNAPFVFVLNKSDLSEPKKTEAWRKHLKANGYKVVEMNALQGRGTGPLTPILDQLEKEINAKRERKGLLGREPRLMVAGLPNSGKSTLLNRIVGKGRFRAGKKPGLTRGAQWVKVAGRYLLLDTPGILYPRIDGERALSVLAAIGSVRRDILPQEKVTTCLFRELHEYGKLYDVVPELKDFEPEEIFKSPLLSLCQAWNMADAHDQPEERRAFERFLNLFSEKGCRITWEPVPESQPT